jgi:hypothetical protein
VREALKEPLWFWPFLLFADYASFRRGVGTLWLLEF